MISAIGIAVIDHIMIIDGFKGAEGLYKCETYHSEGGGMAATALCTASKLGSSVKLFTRIGDDINGTFIREGLEKFNVDTSGIVTVEGQNSFVSFILVEAITGEKQFYSEKNHPVFRDRIDFESSQLEGTDVLLVDGFWMEAALKGAEWASERDIPVVGDFNRHFDGFDKLLPLMDYLIVPSFYARERTGEQTIPEMLRALNSIGSGIPVITQGERGGAYLIDNEIRYYRTFPVECRDSTGAGDAFHGAFCHFLAQGCSIDKCLEMASAAGALNCREVGGRNGLPNQNELAEFMAHYGVNIEK